MSLMLKIYEFCLVITVSIQVLKINAVSAYDFPEIRFPIPYSNLNLTEFLTSLNVNMPDVSSFQLLRLDDIKHIMLTVDKLASKLFKKLNVFVQIPDDLLSFFQKHKFSWNWTRWHPDFSCSKFNAYDINFDFENELFGQHIVNWFISRLLNDHLKKNKDMKPLIMSFQGPTGCGKSYVSKMIVDSLLQGGFSSKFVHTYYGNKDFFHDKEKENYRKRLLHEIPYLLSLCDRSVFIFEEMDKMVPGVIDVIVPYIYFYENSTSGYAANSIFIFISNSGAKRIEEILYDAWLEGVSREDTTLANFSSCLKTAAYNDPGGLQYSEIIKLNLIDVFLPFLPLEREHVKQCILKELLLHKMPINKNTVEYIADQIIYHPPEFELFAESGCKRVPQKVDLYGEIDL